MFCNYCGAQLDPSAQFCTSCGRTLTGASPPAPYVERPLGPFVVPGQIKARVGDWLSAGWELVKADLGTFVLATLIVLVVGGVVPLILHGALLAGLFLFCSNKILGRRAELGDIFQGFNYFVPALLAVLVTSLFTFAGALLCIIPAFVVTAMYQFTYLFMVDKKMDWWPAMKASHEVVKHDYLGFTLFALAGALLNFVGFLCCIAGILVTFPIYYAAITIAYQEIVGFEPDAPVR